MGKAKKLLCIQKSMTYFGVICPGSTDPFNTMFPLAQELQRRGHRVTLFGLLDMQKNTQIAAIEFHAITRSFLLPEK